MLTLLLRSPTAPPAAPFASGEAGNAQNTINWTDPGDTVNYDLYRGVAGGTPTLYQANLTVLTYNDTGLTNGTDYAYYVVAKNPQGSSPNSNTVLLTPSAPVTGNRTTQNRVFRSTQTSPNVGNVRDLASAFGSTANSATVADFSAGVIGLRLRPNTSATAAQPPATPQDVTSDAWRDVVAENANEIIEYTAGTWTIRARLNKTVMTINASVTVRMTLIVFKVSSAGAFIAEIGRVVMPDTTFATVGAVQTLTGSFTRAALRLQPGEKIQVEVYLENIVAGSPGATVTAYTMAFVLDETSANSGAAFTAQPTYRILYSRSTTNSGAGTVGFVKSLVAARSFEITGAGNGAFARVFTLVREYSASGVGSSSATKQFTAVRSLSIAGAGSGILARSLAVKRTAAATGAATVSLTKAAVMARSRSVTGTGTAIFARSFSFARSHSVVGTGSAVFTKSFIFSRLSAVASTGTAVFARQVARFRSHAVAGISSLGFVKSSTSFRSFSVVGAGTALIAKSMIFARSLIVSGFSVVKLLIEMPQSVLNRMTGGGGTVINVVKKIFSISDD